MKYIMTCLFAMACALSHAQETSDKPLVWYENGQTREVWVDQELMVEFGPPADSATRIRAAPQVPRILRRSDSQGRRALSSGNSSPVLRDVPGGPIRALPGNVLVQLDPKWTSAQVNSWLSAHGLAEITKLQVGSNVLLVRSAPGLESLELANRLQGAEGVRWAQPDWWQPVSPR